MKPFRVTAIIGFVASAIAFCGVLAVPLLVMPYGTVKVIERVAVALAVVGLVASSAAVYLGRRDGHKFADNKRTFAAAYFGVSVPLILSALWLRRFG